MNRYAQYRRRPRAGFTFVEVLFAIMILGIGFILIAAMLPVAIKQGQDTHDDITAKAVADSVYACLRKTLTATGLPDTGGSIEYCGPNGNGASMANAFVPLQGNRILEVDRRFAWAVFYQRNGDSDLQPTFWIVVLRRHAADIPEYPDSFFVLRDTGGAADACNSNGPFGTDNRVASNRAAAYRIFDGSGANPLVVPNAANLAQPDRIEISFPTGSYAIPDTFGPGTFILLNPVTVGVAPNQVTYPARVVRLGRRLNATSYELQPGFDLPLAAGADTIQGTSDDVVDGSADDGTGVAWRTGWHFGRGLRDPSQLWGGANLPVGPAQEIGVFEYRLTIR